MDDDVGVHERRWSCQYGQARISHGWTCRVGAPWRSQARPACSYLLFFVSYCLMFLMKCVFFRPLCLGDPDACLVL